MIGIAGLEIGVAGRPYPGLEVSGDAAVVLPVDGGVLLCVVDGLGHGVQAHTASALVKEIVAASGGDDLPALMTGLHRRLLKDARGAAVGLARLDARLRTATWLGVGNIGMTIRNPQGPSGGGYCQAGIVGHNLPTLRPQVCPFGDGSLLVMYSDGLREACTDSLRGKDWTNASAQDLAESLLREFARATDDAIVIVVK